MRSYIQIVSNEVYKDSLSLVTKENNMDLERISSTIMTVRDISNKHFEGVISKELIELGLVWYSMYPTTISKVIFQWKGRKLNMRKALSILGSAHWKDSHRIDKYLNHSLPQIGVITGIPVLKAVIAPKGFKS